MILLDLDVTEGFRRTRARSGAPAETHVSPDRDRFEDEHIAFHERIREGFLAQAKSLPDPFLVVDASPSGEEVFKVILPNIDRWSEGLQGLK